MVSCKLTVALDLSSESAVATKSRGGGKWEIKARKGSRDSAEVMKAGRFESPVAGTSKVGRVRKEG